METLLTSDPGELIKRMSIRFPAATPEIRREMFAYCDKYAIAFYGVESIPENVRKSLVELEGQWLSEN